MRSAPHACPQSCRVAKRAPSVKAANFIHATLGWVSLNRAAEAANPQSAPTLLCSSLVFVLSLGLGFTEGAVTAYTGI